MEIYSGLVRWILVAIGLALSAVGSYTPPPSAPAPTTTVATTPAGYGAIGTVNTQITVDADGNIVVVFTDPPDSP